MTGIFLISGGKDSVAAALLAKDQFTRRVGVMVTVENITDEDLEYNTYLESLLGMELLLVSAPPGGTEAYLLTRPEDAYRPPVPTPAYGGKSLMRLAVARVGETRFKVIRGLNYTDKARNPRQIVGPRQVAPIIGMTDEKVNQFLGNRGVRLHPNYAKGFTKHSHYPCLLWAYNELEANMAAFKQHFPERYAYWAAWEQEHNIPFLKTSPTEARWLGDF